jgi:trk system potassium uptake protein TrkH
MNPRLDFQILGWLLTGLSFVQLVPAGVALGYGESPWPFLAAGVVTLVCGLPLGLGNRTEDRRMRPRDGFLVVGVGWLLASVFGALPYVFSGTLGPVDALFESIAGFTTTGSSVLTDIEATSHSVLLWRALSQWLGGMGIIVFAIAILPLLGIGGMQLFKAEVPGPVASKLTPRISGTARRLWMIYAGFTASCCASLMLAGLGPFDAICHAFTTLATGGFSTRNASIAAFESPAVEWIVIVFMLAAGINFELHYRFLTRQFRAVLRDVELRYFLAVVGSATIAIAVLLAIEDAEAPIRAAAFQVVSLVTTTGFGTDDYALWPPLARFILLQLMLVGGMAGSTAGGIKSLRAVLLWRGLRSAVAKAIHPHAVRPVKLHGAPVSEEVLAAVGAFFTAYIGVAALAAVVMAASGYDILTSISAALTAVSNVGPGFGAVGPTATFAHLPATAKLTLGLAMIAGRLELFTVLVLFSRHFWRR